MTTTEREIIKVHRVALLEQLDYWKSRSKFYEEQLIKILELKDTITPRQIIIPTICPFCKKDLSEVFK